MEIPPIEIKQEIFSDDFNPADLLEVNKEEEYHDLETEINKHWLDLDLNKREKQDEIQAVGYYVVVNNLYYRCTICPFGTKMLTKIPIHFKKTHNITNVTKAPYKVEDNELSIMLKDYLYEYVQYGNGLFHCKVCKYKSNVLLKIKKHVDKLHINVTQRCKICKKVFMYARQLRKHTNRVHKKKRYECLECGYTSHLSIGKHMKTHLKKKELIYYCSLCSYKTCVIKHWNDHKKLHYQAKKRPSLVITPKDAQYVYIFSEKLFKCNTCKFRRSNQHSVNEHVKRNHLRKKPHLCVLCNKSFAFLSELKIHGRVHRKKLNECDDTSSEPLTKDMKIHSNRGVERDFTCSEPLAKDVEGDSNGGFESDFKCSEPLTKDMEIHTNGVFERDSTCSEPLAKDVESHTNGGFESDFKCSEPLTKDMESHTNEGFERDSTSSEPLAKDVEIHTNGGVERDFTCSEPLKMEMESIDNMYYCSLCSYKCELMSSWHEHKICHPNEDPRPIPTLKDAQYVYEHGKNHFQCKLCEFNCSIQSLIKKHVDGVHLNIRDQQCEFCGKRFRHLTALAYHVRTHTGEKPYKCTLCDYASSTPLNKHMKIHNEVKPYQCPSVTCVNTSHQNHII